MNNFKISKNTKWKEVEINGENREIPNDWELKKLNTLSEKIGDGLHGTPKYVEKSNFYFINGNNLNNGKISFDNTTKFVSEEEYLKHKKQLSEDTILLSINGTIGNLAFYNNENVVLGKSAAYINTKNNVNKIYLFYFFKSDQFKKHIEFDSTGSTIKNLSLTSLRSFDIVYPPLCQQSAIADILSTQESIIQDIESLISKYETRLRYLSEELLSGRLRIKEVDGKNVFYKNTEWKEVEINGEMKEIPVDWEVSKISDIAEFKNGYAFNKNNYSLSKNYILVEVGNIEISGDLKVKKENKYIEKVSDKIKSFLLDKNDIVLPMTDMSHERVHVGTPAIIRENNRFILNQRVGAIKLKDREITEYIYFTIKNNQSYFGRNTVGGGPYNMGTDVIKEFEFNNPPKLEKLFISNTLNNEKENLLKSEKIISLERKKFTFLLNNLLSGNYLIEKNTTKE